MASGDIKLSSNFELNSQRALDARINVASIAERDALPTIQRYDRMVVSVRAGETYQMKLGLVDNDLANNLNWGLFGTDPNSHIKNFDTQIIHNGDIIPVYVFGAVSQSALTVKEYTILFVGSNNYLNEIVSVSGCNSNLFEVYENDVLIYSQSFSFTWINSRFRFIVTTPFNTILGKNYKLRFRRSDGADVGGAFFSASSYYENSIPYAPVSFTCNYVSTSGASITGYTKSPIYFIRGSKFSKVETINENVIVTASEMDVKGNARIEGDLIVEKNIIQNGAAYETHAEQLYTEKDLIILREKAIAGLAGNQLSGFKIIKYNGVNNLIFATDLNGIARIGDEGQALQALATREDNPINNAFARWNSTTLRFETVDLNTLYTPLQAIVDSYGMTGFIDGENINIAYDFNTRTITLTGNLTYYFRGTKKILASPWTSPAHANTIGKYFLYCTDGVNFNWSNIAWSFKDVMVAFVNFGTTAALSFGIRETHGLMDQDTHNELHNQIGTYKVSGGIVTAGSYIENTATDAAITPGFDSSILKDEDLLSNVGAWIEGNYTLLYIGATSKATFTIDSLFPFISSGSFLQINNPVTGAMANGINARYYNVYQIIVPATSDAASQKYRTILLQPQVAHTTLAAAQSEDIRGLSMGDLSAMFTEFLFHARITYITANADNNTGKCRIAAGGITYLTGSKAGQVSIGGFTTNNHATLTNREWLNSAHLGTPNTIAGFGASGEAIEILGGYLPLSGGTLTGLLSIYKPATQLEIASDTVGNNAEINFKLQSTTPGYGGLGAASSIKSIPVGPWTGGLNSQADLAFFTTSTLGGTALEYMRLKSGGNLGLGTNNPTHLLSLGGTSARTIWMERNTSAGTGGQGLTLSSGGAIAGTANLAGGDLKLSSGISTGTGVSAIRFFTAPAGASGAADNTPTEKMTILGNGNVGIGTNTPSLALSIGTGSVTYLNKGGSSIIPFLAVLNNIDHAAATYGWAVYDNSSNGNLDIYRRDGTIAGEHVITFRRNNGNVGIGTNSPTSKLQVAGLSSYADNATAIGAGLTVGAFYHTSGVLKVVI